MNNLTYYEYFILVVKDDSVRASGTRNTSYLDRISWLSGNSYVQAIPTDIFRGFSQSLHDNTGIIT
jgi:hypothetical protein